jgi:hypothetical protein
MEPVRERQATVNDLLDRLLDKGVVVSLDLVIGVGGIPLIGVSLRAAVAAIETMIEYGFMKAWDEKTRQYAERELQRKKLALAPGEITLLEMFGSHWYSDGIYRAWRPGRIYLTDRRLILYRKMPAEVLFETPLGSIRGLGVAESVHFNTRRAPLLHLALESGEEVSLYAEDAAGLEAALRDRLGALGVALTETITETGTLCQRDREVARAAPEARVLAEGKMWHQTPGVTDIVAIWRPGWLYLTDQGLLWWSESQRRLAVRIPVEDIVGVAVEPRDLGPLLGAKSVLGVRSGQNGRREAALFAGESLDEWRRAIRRLVVDHEGEGQP